MLKSRLVLTDQGAVYIFSIRLHRDNCQVVRFFLILNAVVFVYTRIQSGDGVDGVERFKALDSGSRLSTRSLKNYLNTNSSPIETENTQLSIKESRSRSLIIQSK